MTCWDIGTELEIKLFSDSSEIFKEYGTVGTCMFSLLIEIFKEDTMTIAYQKLMS